LVCRLPSETRIECNNGNALPPQFVSLFGLTGGNLADALSQVSGEAATGAQQGAFWLIRIFHLVKA
jgi:hypothetical protein